METSVGRVFVFAFAVGAQLESRHRGEWTVIGNVLNDGEARSAVGAVNEGIVIASVSGVEEFAQAVIADSDIRRDGLEGAVHVFRVDNVKLGEPVTGSE